MLRMLPAGCGELTLPCCPAGADLVRVLVVLLLLEDGSRHGKPPPPKEIMLLRSNKSQLSPPVKLYTDSLCKKGTKWPGKSVSDVQGEKCAGGPLE